MPSGGGSAGGGGGGGGGGFGGDSFGGEWRSRNRYSFRRSYNYGNADDCDCKCGCIPGCIIALIVIGFVSVFILIVGLVIGFSVRAENTPKSNISTNFYSPGDSRLLSFSSFFCESVSLVIESETVSASLLLINSTPPLTEQNNFTINSSSTLQKNNYHFWQYHLYPNSKISIDVCTDCSRVFLDIYVIKGNTNVNKWGDEPGENHAQLFQRVSTVCPMKESISYTITEEDEYYFIVHNSFDQIELYYDVVLMFNRYEYKSQQGEVNSTVKNYCAAASGETCNIEIPYGTGSQHALVTTSIPDNVNWSENVSLKTSCSRRHWAYAVVILVPLFVVAVGIAITVSVICCFFCGFFKCKNIDNVDNSNGIDTVDPVDKVDNIDGIMDDDMDES